MTARALPYFPKIQDSSHFTSKASNDSATRPTEIAPIFDRAKNLIPLSTYSAVLQNASYGEHSSFDSEILSPSRPHTFEDSYLYPTLTHNEHLRLTLLWYYTRGIEDDKELLSKLASVIAMVKNSLSWEFGIIGLLDNDHYVRLATVNLPLAMLPRRESTCSHTVNQYPGTVFMVTDMSQDWRFKHSPHVEFGGLRSYAGTQLRCATRDGDYVALGSLCVASNTVQSPLSDGQKQALIRAADLVTTELVSSTQTKRLRERQIMSDDLNTLRTSPSFRDVEASAIEILKRRYPTASVTIQSLEDNTISLDQDMKVDLSFVHDGLWENVPYIRDHIQFADAGQKESATILRAIVGQIKSTAQVVVVSSSELRRVFDDLDSWFVDQAAQIVNIALQERALKQALAAKDTFLRSITHQLRTPIHGVLSSAELLVEELKSRKLIPYDLSYQPGHNDTTLTSSMQTIQSSGFELMTIVNNLLRWNAFTNSTITSYQTVYDLQSLESDVFDAVSAAYAGTQRQGLSIRFEYKFDSSCSSVLVDADLLKESLKCLVLNAMEATPSGSIIITTTLSEKDSKLMFDIVDTGKGIAEMDQARIFLPFEKIDTHSRGAGLGLSLAAQVAASLSGSLSLVSSSIGAGSHFRLELDHVERCPQSAYLPRKKPSFKNLASKFCIVENSKRNTHLLSHLAAHLTECGLERSEILQGSIIVMNQYEPFDRPSDELQHLRGQHCIVMVSDIAPSPLVRSCLEEVLHPHFPWPIIGPFFTSRLNDVLGEVDMVFGQHRKKLLTLPVRQLVPAPQSSSNQPPPTKTIPVEPIRRVSTNSDLYIKALLVDDNITNLQVLQMYCKRRDFAYVKAVNGLEAVSSFCEAHTSGSTLFTLVLMDLQMPESDGVAACQRIREFERANHLRNSAIFMITGQDSVADRKRAFDAGADEFFVKPVSLKKLDLMVEQYFPGKVNSPMKTSKESR